MAKNLSLRTKLLSTTALAVAGTFWLGASPALAIPAGECVTGGTGSAVTITCTGNIPYLVYTDEDNTTITLNADAHVLEINNAAIYIGDADSALIMQAGSRAESTGGNAAVVANQSANVTLNGEAEILLTNDNMRANVSALGVNGFDGANITLNSGSTISFAGGGNNVTYDNYSASGINVSGEKFKITLNGESVINVRGTGTDVENDYYGIRLENTAQTAANRNTITLNGGSTIDVTRVGANTSGDTMGIASFADGDDKYAADVALNHATMNIGGNSAASSDKYAGIFSLGGADGHVTLNASSIAVSAQSANDDNKYAGIAIYQENLSNTAIGGIALTNGSSVSVNAFGSGEDAKVYGLTVIGAGSDFKIGHITLNGGSSVSLVSYAESSNMFGIAAKGYAPVVELDGSTVTINALGEGVGGKYVGIETFDIAKYANQAGHITLNASTIDVRGSGASDASYAGIINISYSGSDKYVGAITLNDSIINVNHSDGEQNNFSGIISLGGGNPITLNGSSEINVGAHYDDDLEEWVGGTDNDGYVGIVASQGAGAAAPTVVLNGTSSVNIAGAGFSPDAKYLGVGISGEDATLTLNSHASVTVFARSAVVATGWSEGVTGVAATGIGNQITLNGDSFVSVGVNVAAPYATKYANGIQTTGSGNLITLNDNARVHMFAPGGGNVSGAGVFLGGDGDMLTLNGHAMVEAYYAVDVDGVQINGDNVTVTLNDHAVIYGGFGATGIVSQGDYTAINVGTGTSVVGEVGIVVTGDQNILNIKGQVIGHYNAGITTAIDTSGGSNSSVTLDSATLIGSVRGGGTDELTLAGSGTLNEGFNGFGQVTMDGDYWNLATGSTNDADEVDIIAGRLAVNGDLTTDEVVVHSGGTLGGSGTITGILTVLAGGTVSPGNSPGTLNVVGPVTFNAGSNFDVEIGATAADLLNATGAVTIAPGAIVNPIFYPGADGFVGDIITGASVTGTFTPGSGAALVYTPGVVSLTATSSSSMNGAMSAGAAQGFTFIDTVLTEAQKSASVGKTLWGTALWSSSTRTAASASSRGFDDHSNGGAFGGDVMSSGDFTLGLAAGYLDGDAITSGGGSRTSIEGYHAAVYTTFNFGGTYLTSAVTGAYQDQDAKRNVFAGGVLVGAKGSPEAWLGGVGLGIGHEFPLNGAFTITPRASLAYQHMARDGYTETGGGTGALSLDSIGTDTFRGRVGAELALKVADKNAMWAIRPAISAALAQEWRNGDTTTTGRFLTTGAAFNADLDSRDQTYLALGAGVDMTIGYGVTAFVNYDGGTGGDAERSGGWRLGARMEW